jgi:DNA polymerase III delta prime subunit
VLFHALEEAVKNGRLGHCLLFVGPDGAGQKDAAVALAQKVFGDPVDAALVEKGSHPDFTVIGPEEGDTMIKIEAVKALVARAGLRPLRASAKFFIIEEAHLMNEVAQNALLKTLEEPGGNAHFILITSAPGGLIETIRSRAQKFYFSPRPQVRTLDEDTLKLFRAGFKYMTGGSRLWPDFSKEERTDVMKTLDALADAFRDVLMIRIGTPDLVASEEDLLDKKECARRMDEEEIGRLIELLADAKDKIKSSLNIKITMNSLWDAAGAAHAR